MAGKQRTGHCGRNAVTARLVISAGSNAPDASRRLLLGCSTLGLAFDIKGVTMAFFTPDIRDAAFFHPPLLRRRRYANAVVVADAPHPPLLSASPSGVSALLKEMERESGRMPCHKACGLVNLDLDPVIFDGRILRPADFIRPYFFPRAAML